MAGLAEMQNLAQTNMAPGGERRMCGKAARALLTGSSSRVAVAVVELAEAMAAEARVEVSPDCKVAWARWVAASAARNRVLARVSMGVLMVWGQSAVRAVK